MTELIERLSRILVLKMIKQTSPSGGIGRQILKSLDRNIVLVQVRPRVPYILYYQAVGTSDIFYF